MQGRSKGLSGVPSFLQEPGASGVRPLLIETGRELTEDDIHALELAPTNVIFPIKHVRAIHHRQAQLVALGRPDNEIAAIVGTSVGRIRDLRTNPAFADLVSYYTEQQLEVDFETHLRVQGKIVDILELTVNEIGDRLEDEGQIKRIPIGQLRQLAEFAADRTIAPPRATQQGSTTPPTKIELNFGFEGKDKEEKDNTIDVIPESTSR